MKSYILNGSDIECKCSLAQREDINKPTIIALARLNNSDIKHSLVRNSITPADILNILAQDPEPIIRYQVCNHRNCNSTTLEWIFDDYVNFQLVHAINKNINTPTSLLWKVRKWLFEQKRLDPSLRSTIDIHIKQCEIHPNFNKNIASIILDKFKDVSHFSQESI